MPNSIPSRLTSMTFGAVDLQRSTFAIHCDLLSGLNDGLDTRGSDTVVPSAAGRIARNRKADVRHIVLRCLIQGVGATEALRIANAQDLRDELETVFDPTASPAALAGTAADGTGRSILARTVPGIVWTELGIQGVEEAIIILDSVVPNWTVTAAGS